MNAINCRCAETQGAAFQVQDLVRVVSDVPKSLFAVIAYKGTPVLRSLTNPTPRCVGNIVLSDDGRSLLIYWEMAKMMDEIGSRRPERMVSHCTGVFQ